MKSKVFGGFLVLLAICMLSHTLLACSEKVASGGTVDENTIAENGIAELHVDSTKVFAEVEPAYVGDYKIDSAVYWYEIHFHSERENYFTHEEDDSYLCSSDVAGGLCICKRPAYRVNRSRSSHRNYAHDLSGYTL
jgi:hypothetical protein